MTDQPHSWQVEEMELASPAPLTRRSLQVLRFGAVDARPKVYVQASVHADETPALLVANHLAERLRAAAEAGLMRGQVVMVPIANPIGLAQRVSGRLLGRFALDGTGNFNRYYPDLTDDTAERLRGKLSGDAEANVSAVRAALAASLAELPAHDETARLRHTLLGLALDADIALDLHCDDEALLHLYLGTPLWPDGRDLAAWCHSAVTLLATASGGNPFDESVAGPWWALAERFPEHPIPPACLAATVELRGDRDVHETLAEGDADALFRFLQGRGMVAGEPGPMPDLAREASPLEAVEFVHSPAAGVLSWSCAPGDAVHAGDVLCTLIDPARRDFRAARVEVRAGVDGVLFARRSERMTAPGDVLAKIAGTEVLAARRRGPLLTA